MSKLKKSKKGLIIIIILCAVFLINFIITKLVYDSCFIFNIDTDQAYTYILNDFREVYFESGKNTLSAYLYDAKALKTGEETSSKGSDKTCKNDALIVIAPGLNAQALDYRHQIKSFVDNGFSVFVFNPTGIAQSEGYSSVGFSQELIDLDCALDFIESKDNFGYNHIILFGHSVGGYAVSCVSAYGHTVDAVVSVSGINSAMEGVMEPSVKTIGYIAYADYPMLWLYQAILFGADNVNICANDVISSNDTPTMIIHGKGDERVSYEQYSIISHKDDIDNKNAEFLLWDNPQNDGHVDILYDNNGFNNELMDKINNFIKESLNQRGEK